MFFLFCNSHLKPDSPLKNIAKPTLIRSLAFFKHQGGFKSQVLNILKECKFLNSMQMQTVKEFFNTIDKVM